MTGSPERGVEDLLELGRRTKLIPFDNPADFPWRRYAVEGLLLLGRTEEAAALAREDLEIAERWGAAPTVAACRRTLGNALGGEEGEALLREAVGIAAGSPARIQHARALVDLGAALRRANKRVEARRSLREGADLAYRAGTAALVERANEELAATGARPRKEVLGGIYSLTASERRVAELAAQDKSNKEIAQAHRLAVIADAHFDVVRVPVVPSWMQKAALAVAAPVGRLLGYRPVYEPTTPARVMRPAPAV